MHIKRIIPPSLSLLALAVLSGCGPGFPIMTREQEALVKNVDTLLNDSSAIKKRVSSLEAGGQASELKKDLAAIKAAQAELQRSLAEANFGIEELRRQVAFVKGSLEESDQKGEGARRSLSAAVDGIDQRTAALDTTLKSETLRLDGLRSSLETSEKRTQELAEALKAAERKIASLENRLVTVAAGGGRADGREREQAEDPEILYSRGYKETVEKNFNKAAGTFASFLSSYPEHRYAANAQYWLGEIYYARGDWERAVIEFDKAVKNYPKSDKAAASLLKQAYSFEKLGMKSESRVLLKDIIDRFPKSPEAPLARKRLDSIK